MYPINQRPGVPGVGIGRYPEDSYDGKDASFYDGERTRGIGNPWFLTTLALGELYYRAETDIRNRGSLMITQYNKAFFQDLLPEEPFEPGNVYDNTQDVFTTILLRMRLAGDAQLLRCGQHMDQTTGAMAEQFNRDSGYMQSAGDLTWSYAAFLTAAYNRPQRQLIR